jgi:signal transduction histidine kinase
MPLSGSYNYVLVALSIFIGMSASYAAIDLAGRVTSSTGWLRHAWLGGGAIAMGIGIWSMHFTGMRAFSLPVAINYDWPTVLLSLLAGIVAAGFSLFVVSRQTMGFIRIVSASIIMGAAIIAVHYVGMDAMRLAAECRYNMVIVTLSALLAVLASFVGLWLSFHFRDEAEGVGWRKTLGAVVAGAAISSMHYTAMAAATFFPSTAAPDLSHAVRISTLGAVAVALATLIVQGLAVLTSFVDRRFAAQETELLSSQILHVQEEERRRIARDLHDDLGQALFAANLKLGQIPKLASDERALKTLSETQSLLGSCVDKLRTIAHLLHPPELETLGLRTAIVVYVGGFRERSGIQIALDMPEHFPRLSPSAENALLKVVQECLLNIQRHSKSTKALIRLEARPDEVTLEIRDEGVGMERTSSRAPDHGGPKFGVGLAGMSERIKQLGGRLEITSGSWGTSVKVILPVGKLES